MEPRERSWPRLGPLLDRLLDLPPDEARRELARLPVEDEPLRERLEAALAAVAGEGGPLDGDLLARWAPLLEEGFPAPLAAPLAPGARLGAWEVEGELGRGGMGSVFAVRRADGAYEQHAALKLLSASADLPSVRARFLRERQILARLEHPRIARLLDGGVADDGRPWLALERVDGEPLTAFADARRLPVEARLDLFVAVLDAVEFAHRNLVVHRDLKPSNILVTPAGEVKLLDFGIAKLLDRSDDADPTWAGAPLTPRYAAPEQLAGGAITTATDVYSLGLVLGELLAGPGPRSPAGRGQEVRERGVSAGEAERPSRRVRGREEVAVARDTTPERLARRLAGDLDAIVERAVATDPAARYPSAEALARDLAAHRAGRPVAARTATAGVRARKFVRRHRVAVAAAAVVALALVGGLVALGLALAESRARLEEARRAEAIEEFLLGLFSEVDPARSLGREVPLREIVDRGAARLAVGLEEHPRARAALLLTLGTIYRRLGLYEEAAPLLAEALAVARASHGPRSPEVARAHLALGDLAYWRDDPARALVHHREAQALFAAAGAAHRAEVAAAEYNVGAALRRLGRFEEALGHERRALERERELHGEESLPHADVEVGIALLLHDLHRDEEAVRFGERALATRRRLLPESHPAIADALEAVGLARMGAGDSAAAVAALEEALAIRRQVFGDGHPEVLEGRNSLASALENAGLLAEALAVREEALPLARRILPPGSDSLAVQVNNHATVAFRLGRFAAAAEGFREAAAIWRSTAGERSARVGTARNNLGFALLELGRPAAAHAELVAALAIRTELAGAESAEVSQTSRILGLAELALGEREAARVSLERAVELARRVYPPRHPRLAEALAARARLAVAEGKREAARADLAEALAIREERFGADNPLTAQLRAELVRLAGGPG